MNMLDMLCRVFLLVMLIIVGGIGIVTVAYIAYCVIEYLKNKGE